MNTFDLYKRADELFPPSRSIGKHLALQLARELAEAIAAELRHISNTTSSVMRALALDEAAALILSLIKPKPPPSKAERMLAEVEAWTKNAKAVSETLETLLLARCRAIAQEEEK